MTPSVASRLPPPSVRSRQSASAWARVGALVGLCVDGGAVRCASSQRGGGSLAKPFRATLQTPPLSETLPSPARPARRSSAVGVPQCARGLVSPHLRRGKPSAGALQPRREERARAPLEAVQDGHLYAAEASVLYLQLVPSAVDACSARSGASTYTPPTTSQLTKARVDSRARIAVQSGHRVWHMQVRHVVVRHLVQTHQNECRLPVICHIRLAGPQC